MKQFTFLLLLALAGCNRTPKPHTCNWQECPLTDGRQHQQLNDLHQQRPRLTYEQIETILLTEHPEFK